MWSCASPGIITCVICDTYCTSTNRDFSAPKSKSTVIFAILDQVSSHFLFLIFLPTFLPPSLFLSLSFSYLIHRSFFSFINRACKRFNYTLVTDFFVRVNQFIKKEHNQRRLRENTQFRYLVSLIAVSPDNNQVTSYI